jgi:hypothetical protein
MTIRLADIWPIASPQSYKLHLARWNRKSQPLEVSTRDKLEWQGWQEYRPARDDFNRPFVFSLILGREAFWKRVLFTRGEQGLNRN